MLLFKKNNKGVEIIKKFIQLIYEKFGKNAIIKRWIKDLYWWYILCFWFFSFVSSCIWPLNHVKNHLLNNLFFIFNCYIIYEPVPNGRWTLINKQIPRWVKKVNNLLKRSKNSFLCQILIIFQHVIIFKKKFDEFFGIIFN